MIDVHILCSPTTTILETESMLVQLTVNGKPMQADVPQNTLLVQMLRDNLHLTGTHVAVTPRSVALAPSS